MIFRAGAEGRAKGPKIDRAIVHPTADWLWRSELDRAGLLREGDHIAGRARGGTRFVAHRLERDVECCRRQPVKIRQQVHGQDDLSAAGTLHRQAEPMDKKGMLASIACTHDDIAQG